MTRLLLALLLATPLLARAAAPNPADFAWQQQPGATLPLTTTLHDESGRETNLAQTLASNPAHSPVILDLGYFHCPALCGIVRNDLFHALSTGGLTPGRDYTLVALSIDPAETPQDALAAKTKDAAQSGLAPTAWHYLTGPASSIAAITSAVGFRDRYDNRFNQFLHPAGLVILTSAGHVSSYLEGVGYTGGDLRAALLRARSGGIARASLSILLLCFHFDPTTGHYTLEIIKVLRLMAIFTVLTIGGLIFVLHRRRPPSAP